MSPILMLLLLALAGIFIYLVIMSLDRARIREYVASRNGKVVFINWKPFGRGWFGERDSRIYKVRYINGDGEVIEAFCKTSMFSGVYFSDENVIHRKKPRTIRFTPPPAQPHASSAGHTQPRDLEEENRRLREENRRLRAEIEFMKKWDDNSV